MFRQESEAVARDEVQRVLQMTEERRRLWEKSWDDQKTKLEQNLQMCQFFFDLRQVCEFILAVQNREILTTLNCQGNLFLFDAVSRSSLSLYLHMYWHCTSALIVANACVSV